MNWRRRRPLAPTPTGDLDPRLRLGLVVKEMDTLARELQRAGGDVEASLMRKWRDELLLVGAALEDEAGSGVMA